MSAKLKRVVMAIAFMFIACGSVNSSASLIDKVPIKSYGLLLITYVCTNSYVYGYDNAVSLSDCKGGQTVKYVAYAIENSMVNINTQWKRNLLEIAYLCCVMGRSDVLTGKNSYPSFIYDLIKIRNRQKDKKTK